MRSLQQLPLTLKRPSLTFQLQLPLPSTLLKWRLPLRPLLPKLQPSQELKFRPLTSHLW